MASPAASSPLPIVAVAGTIGKTTVALVLDRLARRAGRRTVTWLDSGVTIDGLQQVGELLPWSRGLQQVQAGTLDLAIQELPAATIQAVGLPARAYLVGLVTGLAFNDALHAATPAAARQGAANATLAAAIHPRGWLVLNADDLAVADLAPQSAGQVALWALHRRSPPLARHLRRGGAGLYLADDEIVWEVAGRRRPLIAAAAVPATLGGQAAFQVQNVLAAVAAALAIGFDPAPVAAALAELTTVPTLIERAAVLEGGIHCRVLIGRAPSLPALRALARLSGRLTPGDERAIGLAAWPDGLGADEEREMARLLARLYGRLYLHGAGAPRAAELVRAAHPPERTPTLCLAVDDEVEAMRRLVHAATSGDRLLLLAADVPATAALLDSYRAPA